MVFINIILINHFVKYISIAYSLFSRYSNIPSTFRWFSLRWSSGIFSKRYFIERKTGSKFLLEHSQHFPLVLATLVLGYFLQKVFYRTPADDLPVLNVHPVGNFIRINIYALLFSPM